VEDFFAEKDFALLHEEILSCRTFTTDQSALSYHDSYRNWSIGFVMLSHHSKKLKIRE
jgi:hypothetical protein